MHKEHNYSGTLNIQQTSSTDTLVMESATKIVFRMSRWMINFRFRWSTCIGPCRTRYSFKPNFMGTERTRCSWRQALMARSWLIRTLTIWGRLVKMSLLPLLPLLTSLFSSRSSSSSRSPTARFKSIWPFSVSGCGLAWPGICARWWWRPLVLSKLA